MTAPMVQGGAMHGATFTVYVEQGPPPDAQTRLWTNCQPITCRRSRSHRKSWSNVMFLAALQSRL